MLPGIPDLSSYFACFVPFNILRFLVKLLLSVFMLFLVGNIRLFLERLYIASELRKGGQGRGHVLHEI